MTSNLFRELEKLYPGRFRHTPDRVWIQEPQGDYKGLTVRISPEPAGRMEQANMDMMKLHGWKVVHETDQYKALNICKSYVDRIRA
jgi:hypothetical protein